MEGTTRTPGRSMTHEDWMGAAREEYRRLDALLHELRPEEWKLPTDCAEWDVQALVAHLVGGADCSASVREMVRQAYRGRRLREHGDLVDKMNAVQVAERVGHGPARLVVDLAVAGERAVRARSRLPRPVRAVPLPFGPPLGTKPLGYLMDRIYTRDAWMHRMDICRATGRRPALSTDHDGRIVDDVVREWAARHGEPFALELAGPAGGTWGSGQADARLTLDAVEFCRTVSGRAPGEGLLATTVPF